MNPYLTIFVLTSLIAFVCNKKGKVAGALIICIILSVFAGTRTESVAPDYYLYEYLFSLVGRSTRTFIETYPYMEWSFIIIPNFVKLLFQQSTDIVNGSFLMFALLGVSLKMYAINKYSSHFFFSVFLYFGFIFLMSDMITIRAGVASSLFLLSVFYFDEKKYTHVMILIALALIFHYSSVICIFVLLALRFNVGYKLLFTMSIIAIVIAVLKIDVLNMMGLGRFFPKIEMYNQIQKKGGGDELNLFNFRILFSLFIIVIFSMNFKKLITIKYFDTLFKIHIISVILFFLFSSMNMTFSVRTFEYLTVIQVILFPLLLDIFDKKLKLIPYIILILYGIMQYYYLIELSKLFHRYESWL